MADKLSYDVEKKPNLTVTSLVMLIMSALNIALYLNWLGNKIEIGQQLFFIINWNVQYWSLMHYLVQSKQVSVLLHINKNIPLSLKAL